MPSGISFYSPLRGGLTRLAERRAGLLGTPFGVGSGVGVSFHDRQVIPAKPDSDVKSGSPDKPDYQDLL